MFDAQLIAASLQSRRAYEKIAPHITKSDVTANAAFWLGILAEWYARDPGAKSIDKALLVEQGTQRITNPKHVPALIGFMNDLPEAPSPDNVVQVVLELKRHNVGMELASAIASNDHARVSKLYKQFGELMSQTELKKAAQWEDAVPWDELDAVVGDELRVPLAPKILNQRTQGGALPGHHILVVGRPEVGKSTFVINMARGFLFSGQRVLYVGNEDNINVLKKRMRNRLSGMTQEEVNKDPGKANRLAAKRETEKGGALMMRHLHRGTVAALEQAVDEFEPTVVVLDQIRNMETGTSEESKTSKLETVAVDFRRILSTYGLIGVSVTQANDRTQGHGQKVPVWIGMGDIDSSRTGLPGQADLICGIGADQDMLNRNQRAISLPKNKLSDAENNHEGFTVEFDLRRSKVNG